MVLNPNLDFNIVTTTPVQPSFTYFLDYDTNRIIGTVDSTEALKQAIIKILCTERFAYLIYDNQYGIEFRNIFQGNFSEEFLNTEVERIVMEALLADDRILNVFNFEFSYRLEEAFISFNISSIFGEFQMQTTVGGV